MRAIGCAWTRRCSARSVVGDGVRRQVLQHRRGFTGGLATSNARDVTAEYCGELIDDGILDLGHVEAPAGQHL